MRNMKWAGLIAAGLLIFATTQTWVVIASKGLVISGIQTEGTTFGKPAYLHWVLTGFFILFTLTPKLWAKRFNLLAGAVNFAWTLRNYFEISACRGGECPEKQWAIYLLLVSGVVMLLSTLFPDMPPEKRVS